MPNKHINADFLFTLHEMEQELRRLGRTIVKDWKHLPSSNPGKAREMGRAAGFFAAATIISERLNKTFS